MYYLLIDLMKETCNQVLIQPDTCSVIAQCNTAMLLNVLKIKFHAFKLAFSPWKFDNFCVLVFLNFLRIFYKFLF